MSASHKNGCTYTDRIVRENGICSGEAVFKGTRITLRTVLASLADGNTSEEILAALPTLHAKDSRAALEFAFSSTKKA